jgi:hypothetical protein
MMYFENKRAKDYIMQGWIKNARYKWGRAIDFGHGRSPTWPFGITYHVYGGVWNARHVLVPTTAAPRVAHVGNWDYKSEKMKSW